MSVLGIKQQVLSLLHQVLIYEIVVLLQLCQFLDTVQNKLAAEGTYTASIRNMRIKPPKLQDIDKEAIKLRSERLPEG